MVVSRDLLAARRAPRDALQQADDELQAEIEEAGCVDAGEPVSYTHLTLPTTPYV